MNRTICPLKYVVSGICCALAFGLVENSFGQQTLPPIIPVNVPNFTIPFEIEESANSIREVELFVSKDRGRRWTSVARQPVETGKFAFRADSDGEYWFAFRTAALNESVAPIGGQPHLRVSVNIREPIIILPSQPSESGPLTPPKPERFRGDNVARATPKPTISENVVETKPSGEPDTGGETDSNEAETKPVQKKPETGQFLAPKLPGFEPPDPEKVRGLNMLEDLLSGMSPFLDVLPVEVRGAPSLRNTAKLSEIPAMTPSVPRPPGNSLAGSITAISLESTATRPQIVVKWNTGEELWKDAQVDVFRGNTKEGPWSPIAINLANSGGYWWFLSPEDLKPFYVAVRIRSFRGGTQVDVTQSVITVDPRLSASPSERK